MRFEIIDREDPSYEPGTIIRVIGVGGAGGNAVDHMIDEKVGGVDFIVANTDAQALKRSRAGKKLKLGKTGLGAGAKPEVGRNAAEEARDQIAEYIKGAHMVFITAGMGGGTGTGAAPVIAKIARELGILTVAVVTKPFSHEGNRMRVAEEGIKELQKHVDSLIVILNNELKKVLGNVRLTEAFRAANSVLRNAVGGISEIINVPGLINVDFNDVRTVMSEMGVAMMGSANASGSDRARVAAEQAVASPLLEGIHLSDAKGVLVNITSSEETLMLEEVEEVMKAVREFAAEDAHIIFGAVFDSTMGDNIRVTVVATGLGQAQAQRPELEVITTAQDTGTYGPFAGTPPRSVANGGSAETIPDVMHSGRYATVQTMLKNGVHAEDIPAFIRKQAD